VATLVRDANVVEAVIRSDQTGFQVDHCRATCRFNAPRPDAGRRPTERETLRAQLEPERDLYGELLFHQGRFQRVRRDCRIGSTECLAEVEEKTETWFGSYQPGRLMLGDPGRRDASIHAIQVCVPNALLLPVSIDRIALAGTSSPGLCTVEAIERSRDEDLFTYDLEVRSEDGALLEKWDALRLRMVKGTSLTGRGQSLSWQLASNVLSENRWKDPMRQSA
jgi:enediyne polyketide synthase